MAHTDQTVTSDAIVGGSDLQTLTALNALYIDCVVAADAARFDRILADDFLCSNPDGSLVDKAAFLHQTRTAPKLASMDVADLRIRIFGDVALIHGETRYLLADGRPGRGRYTDAWARPQRRVEGGVGARHADCGVADPRSSLRRDEPGTTRIEGHEDFVAPTCC